MKKFLSKLGTILLSSCMILGITTTTTFANTDNTSSESGVVTISDADFDTMLETGEAVYLGDMAWAEIVTYDEMVANISENRGLEESDVRLQLTSQNSISERATSYYVHFYKQFQVGNTGWYPELDIYAECSGINRSFVGIADLNLIRSYNYVSKQFSGKCEAKVENAKSIYWVVNGDFYNYGTTETTFGGTVGIGKNATFSASIKNASNYFGYAYQTGYVKNR